MGVPTGLAAGYRLFRRSRARPGGFVQGTDFPGVFASARRPAQPVPRQSTVKPAYSCNARRYRLYRLRSSVAAGVHWPFRTHSHGTPQGVPPQEQDRHCGYRRPAARPVQHR
ncbi:hypothetical protein OF001_U10455 [Pseudomonas sp. OF001]|nr:hypothetical protein OF001_U10455 [Pseudomonas sp. OF001]